MEDGKVESIWKWVAWMNTVVLLLEYIGGAVQYIVDAAREIRRQIGKGLFSILKSLQASG